MSLVPEYDSDNSDNEDIEPIRNDIKKTNLPSAKKLLSGEKVSGEVFNNPFRAIEIAKLASLEKHVKMVNTDEQITIKNGKKICWNYRKGRCRFGSKCTFAHDSDVQQSDSQQESSIQQKNFSNQIQNDIPTKLKYNIEDNKKRKYTNSVIHRVEKHRKNHS